MMSTASEPLWIGSLHIGDEPGFYGSAAYVGLLVSLPVTIRKFTAGAPADVRFQVDTTDVNVFSPYPGHLLELVRHEPAPTPPNTWQTVVVATTRLVDSATTTLPNNNSAPPYSLDSDIEYLSIRLNVDTSVPPGLFDDFRLTKLALVSRSAYGSIGFQFG